MSQLLSLVENARERRVAIGHFNIGNLEQLKAIAHAGMQLNVPVIIGVSEGERSYFGTRCIADLVKSCNQEHAVPGGFRLFLNADHTHSLEKVREAAVAGFDAILFDGGKLPFSENITQTKEAVRIAKSINPEIVMEGEIGFIGSASEVRKETPKGAAINPEDLTKPDEAKRFLDETGVHLLAPAVGNLHGMIIRKDSNNGESLFCDAPLNIDRIREISAAVRIPLVLHGGSGNTDDDFTAAIKAGVSVIHISTELRVAWRRGLEKALKESPDEIAPYKIVPSVIADIERAVFARLMLFNKN